jgi:hypothetical protein
MAVKWNSAAVNNLALEEWWGYSNSLNEMFAQVTAVKFICLACACPRRNTGDVFPVCIIAERQFHEC